MYVCYNVHMITIEKNTIYNEDCLDTMGRMLDNSIDLVITSPPYDNLRKYEGFVFDFDKISVELFRIIKLGGVVVWVCNNATIKGSETGTVFKQVLKFMEIGFRLHDTMIYAKNYYVPLNHERYEQEFEYMFVLSKGKPKTFNPILIKTKLHGLSKPRSKNQYVAKSGAFRSVIGKTTVTKKFKIKGNIWYYDPNNKHRRIQHPAKFPLDLVKDHIGSWSNELDVVYDPFSGSGTTASGAIALNRYYIGSEISTKYWNDSLIELEIVKKENDYKL